MLGLDPIDRTNRRKKTAEMNDIIGRPLASGDAVAFRNTKGNTMEVGRIQRFTPKMVVIKWTVNGHEYTHYAYPAECVLVPIEDYMMHAIGRA